MSNDNMSDARLAKEVVQAAKVRAVGARLTPRMAMEQAADLIEAMVIALKANTFGSEWGGVFQEVDGFKRRLLNVAEETGQ